MGENHRHKKPSLPSYGLVILGVGMLLVGVMIGLYGLPAILKDREAENSGGSVVPARVNYEAPELALEDLSGQKASLVDYRGQVILVNNWATWCPPCKEEMPTLQEYYERHKDQGFVLIAVEAGESPEEVSRFAHEYGLTFPIWLDPQKDSVRAFKNYNLPNSYVIDRSGIVRLAWTGTISLSNLEKHITPLLEE